MFYPHGYLTVELPDQSLCEAIVEACPLRVHDTIVHLFPCQQNLRPESCMFTTARAWVRIYGLPPLYWHLEPMTKILIPFGCYLMMDDFSRSREGKCVMDRIKIELDLAPDVENLCVVTDDDYPLVLTFKIEKMPLSIFVAAASTSSISLYVQPLLPAPQTTFPSDLELPLEDHVPLQVLPPKVDSTPSPEQQWNPLLLLLGAKDRSVQSSTGSHIDVPALEPLRTVPQLTQEEAERPQKRQMTSENQSAPSTDCPTQFPRITAASALRCDLGSVWNIHGIQSSIARHALSLVLTQCNPSVLYFSETKVIDPHTTPDMHILQTKYTDSFVVPPQGNGGQWLLWQHHLLLTILASDFFGIAFKISLSRQRFQFIFCVNLPPEPPQWKLGLYGIKHVLSTHTSPWLLIGDFKFIHSGSLVYPNASQISPDLLQHKLTTLLQVLGWNVIEFRSFHTHIHRTLPSL
ncbi:hypothetical protein H6P81_020067 [Aristolochia fimbriata]|uniref:DUF4283 domain-containing protein n=1 Tax=Aristolochia fimbriata TaxID=158543 RepID=A0AAV7DXG2_ARIFI|nr:hypothetical protein H6P81_020067 [Aristolochia fimbriata]